MWLTWRAATEHALYGENGFYLRERPSGHFRTSVGASPAFAGAVLRELVAAVDAALGHPGTVDLVDIGAGEGELRRPACSPRAGPSSAPGCASPPSTWPPGPPGCRSAIEWAAAVPDAITGLVIANEWLDNMPLDIVEQTADGPRLVMVDTVARRGAARAGPVRPRLAWLARWWPLREPRATRAEIGRPRDEAWASVVERLTGGRAIADRLRAPRGRPPAVRHAGRIPRRLARRPVPDGSCDITAHVALDACADAGERAGATSTTL